MVWFGPLADDRDPVTGSSSPVYICSAGHEGGRGWWNDRPSWAEDVRAWLVACREVAQLLGEPGPRLEPRRFRPPPGARSSVKRPGAPEEAILRDSSGAVYGMRSTRRPNTPRPRQPPPRKPRRWGPPPTPDTVAE